SPPVRPRRPLIQPAMRTVYSPHYLVDLPVMQQLPRGTATKSIEAPDARVRARRLSRRPQRDRHYAESCLLRLRPSCSRCLPLIMFFQRPGRVLLGPTLNSVLAQPITVVVRRYDARACVIELGHIA